MNPFFFPSAFDEGDVCMWIQILPRGQELVTVLVNVQDETCHTCNMFRAWHSTPSRWKVCTNSMCKLGWMACFNLKKNCNIYISLQSHTCEQEALNMPYTILSNCTNFFRCYIMYYEHKSKQSIQCVSNQADLGTTWYI